ncbi:MAG: sugar phosphate nucleotidyltransferase [Polyangiaceae bacterium]
MFEAMILCAGLGTRLMPLTRELPKPLVPIGDRPVLAHLLDHLHAEGGTLRVVNAHHRPERIQQFVEAEEPDATVSFEPSLLGTAGGVVAAKARFGPGRLIVWNGDILARPALRQLAGWAPQYPIVLSVHRRTRGEGTCGIDEHGRLVRLRGRMFGEEVHGADYLGVFGVLRALLDQFPSRGCLVGDFLLPYLDEGHTVMTQCERESFVDIGSIDRYHAENLRWLDTTTRGDSWIHPRATVAPSNRVEAVRGGRRRSNHWGGASRARCRLAGCHRTSTLARCRRYGGRRCRAPRVVLAPRRE